jgi:hypothetical protein
MMKTTWLKYLGFLGLLGLLGIFTESKGFIGFLGFFSFFAHSKVVHDERLDANINRAARNAFVASIVFFAIGMVAAVLLGDESLFRYAFPVNFVLIITTFVFSFQYYERKAKD